MDWKWFDLDDYTGVLESNLRDYKLDLELMVFWGDDYEPTSAAWVLSSSGERLWWVDAASC